MMLCLSAATTSCSNENCGLIGTWESLEFLSSKEVDENNDGVFHKELTKEGCYRVTLNFVSKSKVKRTSVTQQNCDKVQENEMKYRAEGEELTFIVNGMTQKHRYKIVDCKLYIYGVLGTGKTRKGKERITIASVFKKR
ncbi:hypothetical protein ACFQ1M_13920 [Sungkyunkwania multivorans]|uniref:Lipocalin-like domain-containing protein n=1 Tax=Sungkyunkwania multivorans TaxID=1173618 RepID=A0ABW3D0I7_9FLAO